MPRDDGTEARRLNLAMGVLAGWYLLGIAIGLLVLRVAAPDPGVVLLAGPIVLVAVVFVAPGTFIVLANRRRRLGPVALGTASALAGAVVAAAGVTIALTLR
ncbi:MAG TPA: hypothetical protein VF054_01260 [Micromonosporaceae bacterium]